jgi:branched-chain amino acid transport system ATP-binding protein
MTPLLEVRGLRKSFDEFIAIAKVDLSIPGGGITAIIGPNGAGKTTFINLLTGKLAPDAGQIDFAGADVTHLPTSARVRAGMARTFQVTNIFPRLSTEENVTVPLLALAGQALHPFRRLESLRDAHQAAMRLLGEVGLEGRGNVPAAELSHGDRRLLEIALALATSPRLLLFDEPTAGMGSGERDRVLDQIRRLAASGKLTILLIEHDMEVVFGLAGRIVVLHQGRVIADGPPRAIREDVLVRDIYLGEENLGESTDVAPRSSPGEPLLEVDRLNAGYGLAHVLHDVSFSVGRGEIVALLGRNGAGKTTTLRILAGLTPPHHLSASPSGARPAGTHGSGQQPLGAVRLFGRSIVGEAPEALAALGVSYVPDDRRIFPDLTARENLRLPVLALRRRSELWTMDRISAIFPPLAAVWDRKGRHLSGGEQKMLAIARALVADPALLLLDEPSEGLGPLMVRILVAALDQFRAGGVTVLLADQNLQFARLVADRALVMERGSLVHSASRDELLHDQATLQRLLAV